MKDHLLKGLLDGALATVPMTALMLAAQRAGWLGQLPPERITERGFEAVDAAPPSRPAVRVLSGALHFGFGAAAGALFAAAVGRRVEGKAASALAGMAFGTAVWAASYLGWVPAIGALPPAHRDRPYRPSTMVAAHWLYGAVLGLRTAQAR